MRSSQDRAASDEVHYERRGAHAVVTLNRPKRRNAISRQMIDALHTICEDLERHPAVTLIAGNGRDFAAGADIKELRARRANDAIDGINSRLFDRVSRLPMPTIALLHGNTLGGGAELSYACDFRIGTPDLRIGNPEPGLGILAAAGATSRLRELVGLPLARLMLLASHILDANAALRSGLVTEIAEPDELLTSGLRLAEAISRNSPLAVRLTKASLNAPADSHPLVDELAQAILFETDEKERRMTRFLNRENK